MKPGGRVCRGYERIYGELMRSGATVVKLLFTSSTLTENQSEPDL